MISYYLGSFCCSWIIFLPGQTSPICDWWWRDCPTVSLLFTSKQTKTWQSGGDEGGKGNTLYLQKGQQYNLYVPPQSGWAHEGKIPPIRIHEDFTPENLWLEVKHLKEPPPERSCTCRFATQGHPDYLTACAISKAIHFLVIKPVSSCLLQLSGKEYKKMTDR